MKRLYADRVGGTNVPGMEADTNGVEMTVDDARMYTKPFTIKFTEELEADSDISETFCKENETDRAHSVLKEATALRGLVRAVGRIEVAEDQLSDRRQSVPSPG